MIDLRAFAIPMNLIEDTAEVTDFEVIPDEEDVRDFIEIEGRVTRVWRQLPVVTFYAVVGGRARYAGSVDLSGVHIVWFSDRKPDAAQMSIVLGLVMIRDLVWRDAEKSRRALARHDESACVA